MRYIRVVQFCFYHPRSTHSAYPVESPFQAHRVTHHAPVRFTPYQHASPFFLCTAPVYAPPKTSPYDRQQWLRNTHRPFLSASPFQALETRHAKLVHSRLRNTHPHCRCFQRGFTNQVSINALFFTHTTAWPALHAQSLLFSQPFSSPRNAPCEAVTLTPSQRTSPLPLHTARFYDST